MRPAGLKILPLTACLMALAACDSADDTATRTPAPAPPPAAETAPGDALTSGLFREVAAATGLGFVHFNGATGEYYQPEIFGPGLALLDYDGDGDLDLYLLQGGMLDSGRSPADALFPPATQHWPGDRLFRNDMDAAGLERLSEKMILDNSRGQIGIIHPYEVVDLDINNQTDTSGQRGVYLPWLGNAGALRREHSHASQLG